MSDPNGERRSALISDLRAAGVGGAQVLGAMVRVPRHRFVPELLRPRAYENCALPVGEGQTISQPLVVAIMTESLRLTGMEKVLEIGTGTGYQAAVLAELSREVHTVERSEVLYAAAQERLARLGYRNVTCYLGDGTRGLPEEAPFDAICVTAGTPAIPEPLAEQLAGGGRLVLPVGGRKRQALRRLTAASGGQVVEDVSDVVFVPLIGEFGWPQ